MEWGIKQDNFIHEVKGYKMVRDRYRSAGAVPNPYLAVSVPWLGASIPSCSALQQPHNVSELPLKAFTFHIKKTHNFH